MRKNILIFGHGYATQFIDISNQYTQIFNKDKYNVTVAYLIGEPDEQIRKKHLAENVIFINSPKKSTRGLKLIALKQMLALHREKNFEIVICHRYKPGYIMLLVSLFRKIPLLFTVMHELGTLNHLMRKIMIATLAKDNAIFAGVSNAVRDDLRKTIWNIPKERIITLYNMIDTDLTEPKFLSPEQARLELNISPNHFVFGTIGRLAKNKDQKTLLTAFASIKSQCPNSKLVIIGDGQLETELKNQAEKLKIAEDVIFTGFLADGYRLMKAFDVYISSSIQEAFGRVLLEAMLAKLPIIATRVNGVPEVVGDCGILIDPANPEVLSEKMLTLYQSSKLKEIGELGYQRVTHHFSLQRFKEIFWNLDGVKEKEIT